MQFTKSFLLLAALATNTFALPANPERRDDSSSSSYSTSGFGSATNPIGSGNTYAGNVGSPYGSNIIEISASTASQYKYVMEIQAPSTDSYTVAIWNKYGPDGRMDGWYGNACKTTTIAAGSSAYFAFDEDTNGGFAAAPGSIPTDSNGGYASTWGEFDFGSSVNNAWSGFDVSAIAAQNAGLDVQGMKICDAVGGTCSSITPGAAVVDNAYTAAETDIGGIGGNLAAGPVRLVATLGYSG